MANDTRLGVPAGTGTRRLARVAEGQHAVNAVAEAPANPTKPSTSSRNTPLAQPVRARPWNRRRCTPTVLTLRTDRPNCPHQPS